ncbi:MAG: DMT family transporter [Deltaproteobacteria bacterium]|nr:DMT family transporter [Deltaproteobacteria bacterium]
MWPEVIAILSAMGWAADSVLVRLGAQRSNIFAAAFLSYSVSALCLWSYLLLYSPLDLLWSPAAIYFLLSGCLQPLFARVLFYIGLTRLGVSRAGPLRGAEPLVSAAIAVVFLQERPGPLVYGGTVLIVASIWLISRRQSGEVEWRLFDIVFPLGAAMVAAVSQNLRKGGLLILPYPLLGAAISTLTSLVLYFVFLLATGRMSLIRFQRESLPFFGSAAFVSALAQVLNFVALSRGEVSALVPLFNTTPLFTVLFSSLFLREVEKVTSQIVLGAVLMVAGVVIIASR